MIVGWWETSPSIELAVSCSGARHRLRWNRGQVALADHDDLDAELALVAFGGDEPTCLSYLRLWDDAVADGGFLAEWVDDTNLNPTRLSWLAMALERMAGEGFHEFLRDLPFRRAERMGQFLYRYPRPWLDRAASTVSADIASGDGVECVLAPALLDVAVANRLRRSFVEAVGGSQLTVGSAALVPLHIAVGRPGEISIGGRLRGVGRGVEMTIGSDWLHRVWGAGLGVVDDHLVLEASVVRGDDERPTATLTVVEWDESERPTLRRTGASFVDHEWTIEAHSVG